jgi:ubiquinone/menaquinone biosynthesis C-methylase UbiE
MNGATPSDTAQPHDARIAASYDRRWARYLSLSLQSTLAALPRKPGDKILDIPCGTGELERLLLADAPHVNFTAADASPAMLRQAGRKNGSTPVAWVQCDVSRLPFPDNHFDHVVCASGLHDFHDPVGSVRELHRVLRVGGTLILVDWCADYLSVRLMGHWLRLTNTAFHTTYTTQSCRQLLESARFTVCDVDRFRISPIWKLMRFVCRK